MLPRKYILPKPIYHQIVWMLRDYDRMKEDPEFYADKIQAIENARNNIPEAYRDGIWNQITKWLPYPEESPRTAYSYHKSKFLMELATGLSLYPQPVTPQEESEGKD